MLTFATRQNRNPDRRQIATQTQADFPAGAPPIQRKSISHSGSANAAASATATPNPSSKLPTNLRQHIEARSGLTLEDVRIHRNSPLPGQIGAHAFTKGRDIHLGPGEEKHLPHEAWHTVQQKQGRVKPTGTFFGIPVNHQTGLETEADAMASLIGSYTAPNMTSPDPSAGGAGEGVVQGVFMKDNDKTAFCKQELKVIATQLGMDTSLENKMLTKHGHVPWLYLSNWLKKEGFNLPETNKRKHSQSVDDDEASDEKQSPLKIKKTNAKKKKAVPRGTKKKVFQNNLGFQKTEARAIAKRKYFPSPTFNFSKEFPNYDEENAKVDLVDTISDLKKSSTKRGFRGNVITTAFQLAYTKKGSNTIETKALEVDAFQSEYKSSDQLKNTPRKKKQIFEGIQGLQETLGLKVSKDYGNMLHSERNMVFQMDKHQIDVKIIDAITTFAKNNPNTTVLMLFLVLYSNPKEVCGTCDTALHALTQAEKIKDLKTELKNKKVETGDDFALKIVTGAKELDTARKYLPSFSGKLSGIPSVFHTFPPKKI